MNYKIIFSMLDNDVRLFAVSMNNPWKSLEPALYLPLIETSGLARKLLDNVIRTLLVFTLRSPDTNYLLLPGATSGLLDEKLSVALQKFSGWRWAVMVLCYLTVIVLQRLHRQFYPFSPFCLVCYSVVPCIQQIISFFTFLLRVKSVLLTNFPKSTEKQGKF